MKTALAWCLWLWITVVIVGAFLYAPAAKDFNGQSSRILFFHVPLAWVSFIAFMHAGVASIFFLRSRSPRHDRRAVAAVELGLVFCVLATITGAMWAKAQWGEFWNWDPRQITIVMTLLFYAAYLALRGAVPDPERRSRLGAVYAIYGLAITPFLLFVLPRLSFSLHPKKPEFGSGILEVLILSGLGFIALYFWMHSVWFRLRTLEERSREAEEAFNLKEIEST